MRILHVITGLTVGGAERVLSKHLEFTRVSADETHAVAYFRDGEILDELRSLGIPCFPLGNPPKLPYSPLAALNLQRVIREFRPEILQGSLWAGNIAARWAGEKCGLPVISEIHGDARYNGRFRTALEIRTAHLTRQIVAVSDGIAESYKRIIIDHTSPAVRAELNSKLTVIPNGIDPAGLDKAGFCEGVSRERYGIDKRAFVFGCVGRLVEIKRLNLIIDALASLIDHADQSSRKPVLLVVGEGPERVRLQETVRNRNMDDQVIFTGQVIPAEPFYDLMDCYVSASSSEGLSLALLEAMYFRLPVVSSAEGGAHEVLTDGVNGFVFPADEPGVLSSLMAKMYEMDHEPRRQIGETNRTLVTSDYSITSHARKYRELYDRLITK